jgi:hypothetical protein
MTKAIILSMCLAASSLSLIALAQDERHSTDGPVTDWWITYKLITGIGY